MSCYRLLLFGLLSTLLFQCTPPPDQSLNEVRLNLRDKTQQKLHDFQDRGLTDSLIRYFEYDDPTFRYQAAMALATIQDSSAVTALGGLLKDPVPRVREAAAFALGQIGSEQGENWLTGAFDTAAIYHPANAAILEAIGKIGSEQGLKNLATISTYEPTDTLLVLGQAYGLYRAALNGKNRKEGTEQNVTWVSNLDFPASVRYVAANYLSRSRDIDLSAYATQLREALRRTELPDIRMALALALGKTATDEARDALIAEYRRETDYRVKVNTLRALSNFEYATVSPLLLEALRDPNAHISNVAATYFLNNGTAEDASRYWQLTRDSLHWQTRSTLLGAAMRHMPLYFQSSREGLNYNLRRTFENSDNPYERAALVRSMGENPWNFRYIKRMAFPDKEPVVRTASMEALQKIATEGSFRGKFGANYYRILREITAYLKEAIESGDPGVMAVAAGTLRTDNVDFSATIDSLAFLETALEDLQLPREIETYNEVLRTLNHFRDQPFTPARTDYNHPIEWVILNNLAAEKNAVIRTERGDITIELYRDRTPATVTNFVQLAKQGFYDGKNFHRVVPNFVIQGGCPRGDGYGSLDYTIRSEFYDVKYDDAGYIGMASAGKDTEGTQFFITHSPTPHLDGRYTIFGKVLSGMEIVHQILPGDRIREVRIE